MKASSLNRAVNVRAEGLISQPLRLFYYHINQATSTHVSRLGDARKYPQYGYGTVEIETEIQSINKLKPHGHHTVL